MKQLKRILSFLMAVVILSSFVNLYAGAKAPYKDAAILNSQYDDLDKPTLTLNQSASLLLDFIDKKLKEKNDKDGSLIIDLDVLGTLNCSSIDNALNGTYNLLNHALFLQFCIFPNLWETVNKSAISTFRRASTPASTADLNVIYSVIQFVSDNRTIFSDLVDGDTSKWGFMKLIFDHIDINVNQTLKELLFEQAYPGTAVPEPVTDTADNMIQQILVNLITGAGAPELAASVDLNSTAVAYDFWDKLLQDIYNLELVPLMNTELKKAVREFCGVVYGDPAFPDGNESNLNEYAAVFDINFVVPAHIFAAGATVISDLNSILGEITAAVIPGYASWAAGDNTLLLNNLASAAKYLLKSTDGKLFASYTGTAVDAEIDAMTDQQLFAYIIRSVLNSTVGSLNIPSDADTLVEVAWYALKEVLAQKVPQNDYSAQPKTLNGVLYMLADIGVYYINQIADMNPAAGTLPGAGLIAYGQGLDATMLTVMNWFRTWYGGLFNLTLSQTDGWAALDTLVFSVVPRNWLPADVTGCKDLLTNRILGDMLDLDTAGLLTLFDRRADSELATKTVKKVLIDTAARLINVIFPSAMGSYTWFETAFSNAELKGIAERLLLALYNRRTSIVPVLLPLVNKWIGIDAPQAFVNPALNLPTQIGAATTFAINNESFGINTGATDKNGNFVQDALYKVKIVSLASNIPAITPTDLTGTVINGGDSVNCTLSGTFTANQVLMLTMTYDVYTELGTKLTDTPLTAMAFSFISGVADDGRIPITLNPQTNNYHSLKYVNSYYNQDAAIASVASNAATLIREPRSSTGGHANDSTVSRTVDTTNATLVANGFTSAPFTNFTTNGDGGKWSIPYYAAAADATRPADGVYLSNYSIKATKTSSLFSNDETFVIPHKVVFYNDYGLPGLLSSELGKNRDPANYSDSAAWDEYIFAMKSAVSVVYRPRQASTFMAQIAPAFNDVKIMLDEAVTALEVSEIAAGTDVLATALDTFEPSNAGLDYDDPAYNYFGLADYVPYTYLNYQREAANCRALLAAQQPLTQIDIAYALHRLNLYEDRLIPVQAAKDRLNEVIAAVGSPVEELYTTASWIVFAGALAFAQAVNAQSTTEVDDGGNYVLRQTKVDTAREKLIEAYKMLEIFIGGIADYTQLDAYITEAESYIYRPVPLIYPGGPGYTQATWEIFIAAYHAAIAVPREMNNRPENQAEIDTAAAALRAGIDQLELSPYFPPIIDDHFIYGFPVGTDPRTMVSLNSEDYRLVWHLTSEGCGTGTTVEVVRISDGVTTGTFTIIIFGDVNGDATIDSLDAGMVVDHENYLISWWAPAEQCYKLAADANGDGSIDSIDAGLIVDSEFGGGIIPQSR